MDLSKVNAIVMTFVVFIIVIIDLAIADETRVAKNLKNGGFTDKKSSDNYNNARINRENSVDYGNNVDAKEYENYLFTFEFPTIKTPSGGDYEGIGEHIKAQQRRMVLRLAKDEIESSPFYLPSAWCKNRYLNITADNSEAESSRNNSEMDKEESSNPAEDTSTNDPNKRPQIIFRTREK